MPRLRIESMTVGNFKAFSTPQTIPIRPLTLIYGQNSAGKSSVIHALLGLCDAMGRWRPRLRLQSGRQQRTRLAMAGLNPAPYFLMPNAEAPATLEFHLVSRAQRSSGASPPRMGSDVRLGTSFDFSDDRSHGSRRVDVVIDGEPCYESGDWAPSGVLIDSAIREGLGTAIGSDDLRETLLSSLRESHLMSTAWIGQGSRQSQRTRSRAVASELRARGLPDRAARPIRVIDQIVSTALAQVKEFVSEVVHLGPFRSVESDSAETVSRTHFKEVFAADEHAWARLWKEREARERVNAWIGPKGRLGGEHELRLAIQGPGLPLSFDWAESHSGALTEMAREAIRRFSAEFANDPTTAHEDLDELTPEAVSRYWLGLLHNASDSMHSDNLRLWSASTNRLLPLRHVGFGMSQFLPVLLHAVTQREATLAVEQPELHLHPALQAEIGDLFVDSALGPDRNRWLIESHSEHLLLRIMRRIRETTEGRLPDGATPVRADDVSVVYVDRPNGSSESVVLPMPLDDQGRLTKPWPGGFFEEGFRETFA